MKKKSIKINFYSILYIIKWGGGRKSNKSPSKLGVLKKILYPIQSHLHISQTYPIRSMIEWVPKKPYLSGMIGWVSKKIYTIVISTFTCIACALSLELQIHFHMYNTFSWTSKWKKKTKLKIWSPITTFKYVSIDHDHVKS